MGQLDEVAVAYPTDPAGVGSSMVVVRCLNFFGALDVIPTLLAGC